MSGITVSVPAGTWASVSGSVMKAGMGACLPSEFGLKGTLFVGIKGVNVGWKRMGSLKIKHQRHLASLIEECCWENIESS